MERPCIGFPGSSDGKESACNAGDLGLIPGLGRSPGGGHGNPLQYSCLENPMDRGAWQATDHEVPKSQTQLTKHTTEWLSTAQEYLCKGHLSKFWPWLGLPSVLNPPAASQFPPIWPKALLFGCTPWQGILVPVCVCGSHSVLSDSVTPWTVAHQAPLSMGFSRQEYWSGLPFPSPGDLPYPGIEPSSPALQIPHCLSHQGSCKGILVYTKYVSWIIWLIAKNT